MSITAFKGSAELDMNTLRWSGGSGRDFEQTSVK